MPQSDQPDDATAKAWRQVNNIIQELLYTEKAYCKSLNIMVGEWYEPLAARVGTDEQVLTQQQINVIFGNITIINNLHKDLLKDLEEQGTDPGDIGKVFREFSPYLKMYTAYLNNNAAGNVQFVLRKRLPAPISFKPPCRLIFHAVCLGQVFRCGLMSESKEITPGLSCL